MNSFIAAIIITADTIICKERSLISRDSLAPTSQLILLFASLSGLVTHSLLGHPDYFQSLLLAIGVFGGGLVGARLSLEIKERYLQIIVSAVIIVAAIKLFIDSIETSF